MDPEHKFETSSYLCYKMSHLIPISFKISLLGLSLPYSPHPLCLWRPWCIPKVSWIPKKQRKNSDFPIKLHPETTSPSSSPSACQIHWIRDKQRSKWTPWICVSCESVACKICGDTWYMQLQGSSFSCISSSPAIHLHSFAIPRLRHASMGIPDRP